MPDLDILARPPSTPPGRVARSVWVGAALVGLASLGWFGYGLADEGHFADESAYISQAYYGRVFASGDRNDPAWLAYPAFDLPPLPKYLIGASLALGGHRAPGPADALAWYRNTSLRFVDAKAETAARVPSVCLGALGCVAIYGLGVLFAGRTVGLTAAALLALNPLYRMHARRAMSDVPCESFLLASLFFALLGWTITLDGRRRGAWWSLSAGILTGLSLSSKMSGLLAPMVVAAWTLCGAAWSGSMSRTFRLTRSFGLYAVAAVMTVLAFNPFLTTDPGRAPRGEMGALAGLSPLGRFRRMSELRMRVAADQQVLFPHNAVRSTPEKLKVTAVQGFGRFGPFGPRRSDSEVRFDWRQDFGAVLWLPVVAAGAVVAGRRGFEQSRLGLPPTAWAVLVHFVIALAVVAGYLPMAWDRYFLAIQAPSALLAAGLIVWALTPLADLRTRPTPTDA